MFYKWLSIALFKVLKAITRFAVLYKTLRRIRNQELASTVEHFLGCSPASFRMINYTFRLTTALQIEQPQHFKLNNHCTIITVFIINLMNTVYVCHNSTKLKAQDTNVLRFRWNWSWRQMWNRIVQKRWIGNNKVNYYDHIYIFITIVFPSLK